MVSGSSDSPATRSRQPGRAAGFLNDCRERDLQLGEVDARRAKLSIRFAQSVFTTSNYVCRVMREKSTS